MLTVGMEVDAVDSGSEGESPVTILVYFLSEKSFSSIE